MRGKANDVEATGRVLLLPPAPIPNSDRERGQVDMSRLNKVLGLETDFQEEGRRLKEVEGGGE